MNVVAAASRIRDNVAFWLAALGQEAMDLSLRTHSDFRTRIVESPGTTLDDAALAALVADPRTVAGKTLPAGELAYGIFSGTREAFARAIVTRVSDAASGRPIAFNALG